MPLAMFAGESAVNVADATNEDSAGDARVGEGASDEDLHGGCFLSGLGSDFIFGRLIYA
jgi:hypothetical protein